jgi:hypothetical protein
MVLWAAVHLFFFVIGLSSFSCQLSSAFVLFQTPKPKKTSTKMIMSSTSTTTSSSSSTLISTNELLSTIIHATLHGSSTIRTLSTSARCDNNSENSNTNNNKIQYKETGDARSALTIADIGSQRVIISSLLHKWGKTKKVLNIVGEEDDSVQQTVVMEYVRELDECLLEHSNLSFYLPDGQQQQESSPPPPPPEMLDLNDLTMYNV